MLGLEVKDNTSSNTEALKKENPSMDQHELFNSSQMAAYRTNTLFSFFGVEGDLQFYLTEGEKELSRAALSLHVHEYIHYLHNISTTSGLQLLKNRLIGLRVFNAGADRNGHFVSASSNSYGGDPVLFSEYENDLPAILGSVVELKKSGHIDNIECRFSKRTEATSDPTDPLHILGVDISFTLAGREEKISALNFGYSVITEGVAYEIERELRKKLGEPEYSLDQHVSVYPYLLYRKVVEYFVGRKCSTYELIQVGTLALQNKIPSWGLYAAMMALEHDSSVFNELIKSTYSDFDENAVAYQNVVSLLIDKVFKNTLLAKGLKVLDDIVRPAIKKRQSNMFYEDVFLRNDLLPENFFQIAAEEDLAPRCVVQKTHNGGYDGYWIGMGVDHQSIDDSSLEALSILQCAIHFTQLHLTSQGKLVNTIDLKKNSTKKECPYLNICPIRQRKSNPSLCENAPWMHDFESINSENCWYGAGVQSLRNIDKWPEGSRLYVTKQNVAFREGPYSKLGKIGFISSNYKVRFISKRSKWVEIEFYDHSKNRYVTGWTYKKFLRLINRKVPIKYKKHELL